MIKIINLSKSFGNLKVLKNIALNVPQKTIFGFIGVNGAGKSTLIKCLMNFLQPETGDMFINNIKVKQPNNFRKHLGYLPEVFQPPLELTCGEFLSHCYQLVCHKKITPNHLNDTLAKVGLSNAIKTKANNLSKGMRQRLGLAQTIIHQPSLLILDEPFSGLDPIGRFELKKLLQKLYLTGVTIFFSSHNLTEIQDLCTNIAILHNGTIQVNQNTEEILKKYNSNNLEEVFLKIISYDSKE